MEKRLPQIPVEDRLIIALDLPGDEARELVRRLKPRHVGIYKVGLQLLLSSSGLGIVTELGKLGARIFLDLKMLDIPETVVRALDAIQANHRHIVLTTIHAFTRGLEAALAARDTSSHLKVLVVTLLTSMDENDLRELGIDASAADFVMNQVRRAKQAGCDGVIASGLEAGRIREEWEQAVIVTPGIRPAWAAVSGDDQKRIVTPRDAILNGADYIVVGRPIYQNPPDGDPLQAVERIQREIAQAVAERDARAQNPGGRKDSVTV